MVHLLGGGRVVDVGCDHGGLALTLQAEGCGVIAVEKTEAPRAQALLNAGRLGVELDVRLGDGLDVVPEPVDLVVMCGMGARTMLGIVERAGPRVFGIVAQANAEEWRLLEAWGVRLVERVEVEERGRRYAVLGFR